MAGARANPFWPALASLVLYLASAARGDILYLRDGSRVVGKLIAETKSEYLFRVESSDDKFAEVRKFPRGNVERVERGEAIEVVDDDSPEEPVEISSRADYDQWLREAFELIERGDLRAGVRVLSRLARIKDSDTLARLDATCRAARGKSLDEFVALKRYELATNGTEAAIKFGGVTEYESAALGRLLESRIDELLERTFEGRTIRQWMVKQGEITRATSDSPALVRDARLASALLAVRIKHDPRLRQDREERASLNLSRDELARLAARVAALPGFNTDAVRLPSAADFGPPHPGEPSDGRELYGDEGRPAATQPARAPR